MRSLTVVAIACLAIGSPPCQLRAQGDAAADTVWVTDGLGSGPYGEMSTLLEVTIFNIDVLVLTVRVTPDVGDRLAAIVSGRSYSDALADSVAAVILGAERMAAHQRFVRDVGFGRLLGGMRESSRKAAEAGFVTQEYHTRFAASLPELFGVLEERGARDGDEIFFEVVGDTVSTTYRTFDGDVVVRERGADAEGRAASIPSFFAPGSRFRRGLVESLLNRTP